MEETITISLEPLSINNMHCRDQRYLTAKAQDWIRTILHLISSEETIDKLEKLREYFDKEKHVYELDIIYYYPKEKFYTINGFISSKAHDLSNIEKTLIDVLFLPKHFGDNPPFKAKNLNIDDKYITDLHSHKRSAEDHLIEINIKIKDLDKLDTNCECD